MIKRNICTCLLCCGLAVSLAGCASDIKMTAVTDDSYTLSVSGKGTAVAIPDVADLVLGIEVNAKDAKTAKENVSTVVDTVVAELKEIGIEDSCIQTSGAVVSPRYDYGDDIEFLERLVGYQAFDAISLSGVPIDSLGEIQDIAIENGINELDGVELKCSNYDEIYSAALEKAVEKARTKAENMAAAAGEKILRIKSMDEGYENDSVAYNGAVNSLFMDGKASLDSITSDSGSTVEAGTLEIKANVEIVYELAGPVK